MDNKVQYDERLARVEKAINLEPVDRLPVIFMGAAFAPRYMGMSMAKYCADPDAAVDVTVAAMNRPGNLDGCNLVPLGYVTVGLTAVWLSRVGVPGRDLPDDSLWQVQEAEVMSISDYDTIINQGWQAFLAGYMPKVIDMAEFRAAIAWTRAICPGSVRGSGMRGWCP